MRRCRRGLAAVLAAALGGLGCGGDAEEGSPGLAGMYAVEQQRKIRGTCEGQGDPQAVDPAYVVIIEERLVNGLVLNVYGCTSSARSSCDESGFPLAFLASHAGGGEYIAEQLQRTSADQDGCFAIWTGTRIRKTATGVELRTEERTAQLTRAQCDASIGNIASGRSLPCAVVEVRQLGPR